MVFGFFALVHLQSMWAQTPCESLGAQFFVDPTEPTRLALELEHDGSIDFLYPSVRVLFEGEVIAEGETLFFQFPEQSVQLLEPTLGIAENAVYNFTVEVYSTFGSFLECTLQWEGIPYSIEECFNGELRLSPTGPVAQEIEIKVIDELGLTWVNDNVWFASNNPSVSYPICLERACYTVAIEPVGSVFQANYLLTFERDGFTYFSRLLQQGEGAQSFSLDAWEGCSFVSVPAMVQQNLKLLFPQVVQASQALNSQSTGVVRCVNWYGLTGRMVNTSEGSETRTPSAAGLYIVQWELQDGTKGAQKIMVLK
jgi:hypothetical protein